MRLMYATSLAVAFTLAAATAAAATTVYSSTGGMGSHSGRNFYDQAYARDTYKDARTNTWITPSNTLPAGYIGSEGRLFTSSGALCKTSGMLYNDGPATAYDVGAYKSQSGCSAGYFYSYGKSAAWDGTSYSYYYTFRSPNIYMS